MSKWKRSRFTGIWQEFHLYGLSFFSFTGT